VFDDEDLILTRALGALGTEFGGSGGGRGATFAAKRLKKDVHEIDLTLPMSLGVAVNHVGGILAEAGRLLETEQPQPTATKRVVRAIVGGGLWNMNPVLITVGLTVDRPESTSIRIRGAAKEGLIKQRAGEKTGKRVVGLLTQRNWSGLRRGSLI
jgi:hypothetical protein